MAYKISLLNRYETCLYKGDYSHGTFFDGCAFASSLEEIKRLFLDEGIIESFFEATKKYVSNEISTNSKRIEFLNKRALLNFEPNIVFKRGKHAFGDGFFFKSESRYTYFYWLNIDTVHQ